MSGNISFDTKQILQDFKPAVKNIVSNVSLSTDFPVATKYAQKFIFKPETELKVLETTKNVLSGVSKENFDAVFNTVKKVSKANLKKNSNLICGGAIAGKSGGKKFGKIFLEILKKMKFKGKLKYIGVAAALGIATYLYVKN